MTIWPARPLRLDYYRNRTHAARGLTSCNSENALSAYGFIRGFGIANIELGSKRADMTRLQDEIFKKYGLTSVVAVLIAALGIWVAAHLTAAPGAQVSVLWGLVQYQKRAENPVAVSTARRPTATPERSVTRDPIEEPLAAVDLPLSPGLTPETSAAAVERLRGERKLRQLTAFESGLPAAEIPPGTYFFLLGSWLETWDESLSDRIAGLMASRFKRSEWSRYELHKTQDELFLVVFITESDGARVSHLNGDDPVEIVAAPKVEGGFTVLISLPVNRIVSVRPRDLESRPDDRAIIALDMVVR